jgi:hypothetical protein
MPSKRRKRETFYEKLASNHRELYVIPEEFIKFNCKTIYAW